MLLSPPNFSLWGWSQIRGRGGGSSEEILENTPTPLSNFLLVKQRHSTEVQTANPRDQNHHQTCPMFPPHHTIRKERRQTLTPVWPNLIKDQTNRLGRSKNPAYSSWQLGLVVKTDSSLWAYHKNKYFPATRLLDTRSATTAFIFSLSSTKRRRREISQPTRARPWRR